MALQNKWKYCADTTNQHPISKKFKDCVEKLDTLCKEEGAKKTPFSKEQCLNIDRVENILAQNEKRNARKTMDISFGLKSGNEKRVILCELRLNYKNVNNLKKSELDSKISNSRNILGHSTVIFNPSLFIFTSQIKNQAYRLLRRLYSNKNTVKAIDLNDLKKYYFE